MQVNFSVGFLLDTVVRILMVVYVKLPQLGSYFKILMDYFLNKVHRFPTEYVETAVLHDILAGLKSDILHQLIFSHTANGN